MDYQAIEIYLFSLNNYLIKIEINGGLKMTTEIFIEYWINSLTVNVKKF